MVFSLLAREINWLETGKTRVSFLCSGKVAPYSLGKLIDWKRSYTQYNGTLLLPLPPYSLGKLIDWKRIKVSISNCHCYTEAPYSLGKLIDWKPWRTAVFWLSLIMVNPPYSLGKLIDWKRLRNNQNQRGQYHLSLLAREINWLETTWIRYFYISVSHRILPTR